MMYTKVRDVELMDEKYLLHDKGLIFYFANCPMSRVSLVLFLGLFFVLSSVFGNAEVLVSQVYYDAVGADDGYEWIELHNSDDVLVNLSDYKIYYSKASNGSTWDLIFDGQDSSFSVFGKDYFVIGDEFTSADIFANLVLQNTRGAIKVEKNGAVVDLMGYGDSYLGYYVGTPARVVSSGQSVSRINYMDLSLSDNRADYSYSANPIFNSVSSRSDIVLEIQNVAPTLSVITFLSAENLFVNFNGSDLNGGADISFLEYYSEDLVGNLLHSGIVALNCSKILSSGNLTLGNASLNSGNCIFNTSFLLDSGSNNFNFRVLDSVNESSDWVTLSVSKDAIPSFEIVEIFNVEAYPGQDSSFEFTLKNTGEVPIVIEGSGSFSNGKFVIPIRYFSSEVISPFEQRSILVDFAVPEIVPSGKYSGKLVLRSSVFN